jgi:soluble lytic murein transglycosylase-like protein
MSLARLLAMAAVVVATVAVAPLAGTAHAEVYSYVDAEGVVHFTNMKPRGKDARKWKRVQADTPEHGKAAASRGSCERCDVVPSRDRSPARFRRYDEYIYEAAELYRIPVALIRAVIKVESDYDPRVVSSMGARGLMQLMPDVMEDMGVRNVHDPRENILGGTRLLRVLANRYEGDLVLTIAAYHSGMGSLQKYRNTVPPYENTRKYLRMVLERYYKYKEKEKQSPLR